MKVRHWLIGVLALAASPIAVALAGTGDSMGPSHQISVPAFLGYYDGHKDTYLSTDISNPATAKAEHINFSRKLGASTKTAEEIYFVSGRAAAGQIAVFSSEPGEKTYTPLWHEEFVTWKSGVTPQLLVRDDQINELKKKGMLSVRETTIVLNCPIVKVGK